MKTIIHLFLVLLAAAGISCTKDEGGSTEPDEDQILRLVYSSYKCPQGFYQENLTKCSMYYENSVSVKPMAQRKAVWYELSTEEYSKARAWSDSSSVYSSAPRAIVSERETEQFFEFTRSDASPWSLLSRVHKASYLDRSMVDRFKPGPLLGMFKKRPILSTNVKNLIEYLWFIENYETAGTKVITEDTLESETAYQVVMTETRVSYGDFGLRDMITIYESTYSVSKLDGTITLSRNARRVIEGHKN